MPDAISLIASGSGQAGITSAHQLVTQVCRPVGGESETGIRAQGLDCLNRVRIEMNQHDWKFMKRTDDPITLVNGTSTYSLESAFRKPSYAKLIDASAVAKFDLDYMDDEYFAHANPDLSTTGQPVYYLLRNDFEDGLVTVFPIPNASTATDYRLVVEYYARIGAFADSHDPLELPEEATNLLVIGGQAYLIREREKNSPAAVQAFADFMRVKQLLLANDRRVTEEKPRFTLTQKRKFPFGTMLIQS